MSDTQIFLFFARIEQIVDLLVVEFIVRTSYDTLALSESIESAKKFGEAALHESAVAAHHRICLSRACLPIGKNTAVIALESIHQQFFTDSMEDVFLLSFGREDAVEGKGMFL